MKNFNEYTDEQKAYIVKIMRADFNTKCSEHAWLEAAKKLNPPIIHETSAVAWNIVLHVAEQAGETVIK